MKWRRGSTRKAMRAAWFYFKDSFDRYVEIRRHGDSYIAQITIGREVRILEVPDEALLDVAIALNMMRRSARVLTLEIQRGYIEHTLEVPRWAVPELRRLLVAEALARAKEQEPEEDGVPCATT